MRSDDIHSMVIMFRGEGPIESIESCPDSRTHRAHAPHPTVLCPGVDLKGSARSILEIDWGSDWEARRSFNGAPNGSLLVVSPNRQIEVSGPDGAARALSRRWLQVDVIRAAGGGGGSDAPLEPSQSQASGPAVVQPSVSSGKRRQKDA